MRSRWEGLEDVLVQTAEGDIEATGSVAPALAAFSGEHLRFLAWLRPFEKGQYHDAFIELFALAMPLDADRLAVSVGGRAWSFDDPIPPVTEGGDLRQRTLVLHVVDGSAGRPRASSVLRPFDVVDGRVRWGDRVEPGAPEGWIPAAMELAVRTRRRLSCGDGEILRQAQRVARLGHALYLAPDVEARLLASPGHGVRRRCRFVHPVR